MSDEPARGGEPGYHQQRRRERVDSRIAEHESRITKNEKRWLLAKGAIAAIAVTETSGFVVDGLRAALGA